MALFSDGDASGHDVANVAFHVGVDGVLAGAPDGFHNVAKFAPVVGSADPIVGVSEAAGLESRPAKGVNFVTFLMHDGAVARDDDLQMFVWLALDANGLVKNLSFDPFSVHSIFVGSGGIELLDVEVLHIGAVVCEAPGDVIVVADDNERCAGKSESLGVESWGGEMNFVPDGRDR